MIQPQHAATPISLDVAARILSGHSVTEQLEQINQGTDEVILSGSGYSQRVSDDGRFVAFAAQEKPRQWGAGWNVGPPPPFHLFLRDRSTAKTTRVDLTPSGQEPASGITVDGGRGVGMSADGRVVAFASSSPDLVAGDNNACSDVFAYDRQSGMMRRVSVASDGTEANGPSYDPVVSADGQWVAFRSSASNLVPGDHNFQDDIFLHHLATGETRRVSVASDGSEGRGSACMPAISGDGRFVAFSFIGTGLAELPGTRGGLEDDFGIIPQIYLHDRETGETRHVSRTADGEPAAGDCVDTAISADGSTVAFASRPRTNFIGGTNLAEGVDGMGVYTWRADEGVRLASVDGNNEPVVARDPSLSADGSRVAFTTGGRVGVRDTDGAVQFLERPSGHGSCLNASLSGSGNSVAFTTFEENRDLPEGMLTRVFTFDLNRVETLASWARGDAAATEAPSAPIVVGDDFVTVGGVRIQRRRAEG